MIPTTSLYDVDDIESFVAASLTRSHIIYNRDEHDELIAEGITILYELAARYQPHMPGYQHPGRFSGYAAALLPRRMQDAYYRLHPEHLARRNEHGKRVRDHAEPPISLHVQVGNSNNNIGDRSPSDSRTLSDTLALATTAIDPTLHTHQHANTDPTRLPLVASAMSLIPTQDRRHAQPILGHMIDQTPTDQIAQQLGTTRGEVVRVRKQFEIAIRQAQQDALEQEAA